MFRAIKFPRLKFKQPESPEESEIRCAAQIIAFVVMSLLFDISGAAFLLISGSDVATVLSFFSTAVLYLLPACMVKLIMHKFGTDDRAAVTAIAITAFIFSFIPVSAYYVSHDYELGVYRYMRATDADVYYYGGYDEFKSDYIDPLDFMKKMQSAPASIVLEGMNSEKANSLTPEQLEDLNSKNLWEYLGFNEILGTTIDEVEDSMAASRTMNAYEFTFNYRGLTAKTYWYELKNPGMMIGELKDIAKTGSHSVRFSLYVTYLVMQLMCTYMVCMHFGVNDEKHIVCYVKPSEFRELKIFFRYIAECLREMKGNWQIKEQ